MCARGEVARSNILRSHVCLVQHYRIKHKHTGSAGFPYAHPGFSATALGSPTSYISDHTNSIIAHHVNMPGILGRVKSWFPNSQELIPCVKSPISSPGSPERVAPFHRTVRDPPRGMSPARRNSPEGTTQQPQTQLRGISLRLLANFPRIHLPDPMVPY